MSRAREGGVTGFLRKFDLFPKLRSEERVRTTQGATLSLVTGALLSVLFLSEFASFASLHTVDHVSVDPAFNQKLRIQFNVTFHALPCGNVSLDAMDVAGDQQEPEEHSIWKQRLSKDPELRPIGLPFPALLPWEIQKKNIEAEEAEVAAKDPNYCGPCYTDRFPGRCCNTCEDVKAAYVEIGWNAQDVMAKAEQCRTRAAVLAGAKSKSEQGEAGEGCLVYGHMLVNKVAGNLNVAMGEIHVEDMRHIHQFVPSDVPKYNTTHTVHELSFGPGLPGLLNPLEGKTQIRDGGAGMYQYQIKLVPTVFVSAPSFYWFGAASDVAQALATTDETQLRLLPAAGGDDASGGSDESLPSGVELFKTNQYNVQLAWHPATFRGVRQNILPGVFFLYDFSPFMVTVTQRRGQGILEFLTGVAAIIGGVLTFSELLDRCLHRAGSFTAAFDLLRGSKSPAVFRSPKKGIIT